MKYSKLFQEPGSPARHLTPEEIEAICMGRMDRVATGWREHHLLLCHDCLEKAELEPETLRELRTALRSFPAPAAMRFTASGSHRNCIDVHGSAQYEQARKQCYAT